MPPFYPKCGQEVIEQASQIEECLPADARRVFTTHDGTGSGVEHPLREIEAGLSCRARQPTAGHLPRARCALADHVHEDIVRRMPRVAHPLKLGFVVIVTSLRITWSGHIWRSTAMPPRRAKPSRPSTAVS